MHSDRPLPASEDTDPWSQIDLSGSMADASRRVLADVERRKIVQALKEASGQSGAGGRDSQVSFKTLQAKTGRTTHRIGVLAL